MKLSLSPCLSWAGGSRFDARAASNSSSGRGVSLKCVVRASLGWFVCFDMDFCEKRKIPGRNFWGFSHQHPLPPHKAEGSLFSRCLHLQPWLASEPVNPQGRVLSCHCPVSPLEQELLWLAAVPAGAASFALHCSFVLGAGRQVKMAMERRIQ